MALKKRIIWCCGCEKHVQARLTDGSEVYPHRIDLSSIPFWICDHCRNYVGCHHKTKRSVVPLGNITTPEVRHARMTIHKVIDPLWKGRLINRKKLYAKLAEALGVDEYHTANIKSLDEARAVWRAAKSIEREILERRGLWQRT